jgi:hypothetical protein
MDETTKSLLISPEDSDDEDDGAVARIRKCNRRVYLFRLLLYIIYYLWFI